ncbi:hypothetical protein SLI_4399 [Streptomyces lividans 1326]|uniref:Uncharacterized protein n=1 Tax=Streptomyces lividans 1326 TaxID=1200984 RepID=A0A7U9HBZ1_STRLI|nr:hypothetical protein SLI_4399 [Streptomyces lividans 1326]
MRSVGVTREPVRDDEHQVRAVAPGRSRLVHGVDGDTVGRTEEGARGRAARRSPRRLGMRTIGWTTGGTRHMTRRSVAHVGYSAGQRTRAT